MDDRYSRQILFTPIGEDGQKRLSEKHVLIIGLGALGTKSAEMLVRAGVGTVTLVDRDYIEWSNLQRQHLFTERDAKERLPKAVAAKYHLEQINHQVTIYEHVLDVTPEEIEWLTDDIDLILDGTDNFDIRLIINDMSQKKNIPWIYGSCVSSYGMSFTIIPEETPCLHCFLETVPIGGATCDTAGIIGPAASQVVIHQVTEALKLLVDRKEDLRGKLISFDLWKNEHVEMDLSSLKREDCLSCGSDATYPFLSFEKQMKTAVLCGRQSVQIRPPEKREYELGKMGEILKKTGGDVEVNPFLLSFAIENERMVLFKDGRALIHGTNDIDYAKTLYHRYFS